MNLVIQVIRRARVKTEVEVTRNMALLDVYGRLILVLDKYPGPRTPPNDGSVTLEAITHQEPASRVGSSREAVSRLLKDLERGGYVKMGTKRITLVKKMPARL